MKGMEGMRSAAFLQDFPHGMARVFAEIGVAVVVGDQRFPQGPAARPGDRAAVQTAEKNVPFGWAEISYHAGGTGSRRIARRMAERPRRKGGAGVEKRRRRRVLTGGGEKRKIEMTFVYGFVYGANRLIYLDRSLQRTVCRRPALCRYGPAAAGYKTC